MSDFTPPAKKRTHDSLYLDQTRDDAPKHSFQEVHRILDGHFDGDWRGKRILDVGSAVGHFPHFLKSRHQEATVEGLELRSDLIEYGRGLFPNLLVREGDVTNPGASAEKWEAITMLGVLSIFDNIAPAIENMLSWLVGPGAVLLIHGMFNPVPVDTFVRYRRAESDLSSPLENGWNIVSQHRLKETALSLGAAIVSFHELEMPFDLDGREEDPLRSWTERRPDGSRFITNGLCLIQPQYIAEIKI